MSVNSAAYEQDAALVDRCLRRDPAAQRELFRAQFPRVQASLYRILGSSSEAEDLVQETFLEVFRSLAHYRAEARLSTWIDRIVVRVAMRHISRRRPPAVQLELVGEPMDGGALPDARAQAREGVRRLYQVVATLGPASRVAFTLHVIDGRSLAEVAQLTSSSLVATKLRVWRGRQVLERAAGRDPLLASYLAASAGTAAQQPDVEVES